MCGIVGVVNSVYGTKIQPFMRNGCVVGQLRGFDSTGIMQQDQDGKVYAHKSATIGTYFATDKTVEQLFVRSGSARSIVIHHRAATQGKVVAANAHPFVLERVGEPAGQETKIIGVHNGSLNNWKSKVNAKHFEVDSAWALSRIADVGEQAFKEIEGPFAFVWMDTAKKDHLYMIRNSGRPMHIVRSKDKKQVYFASEAGMLAWLVDRNDIETENQISVLDPNYLYDFDSSGAEVVITAKKIDMWAAPPKPATVSNVVPITKPASTVVPAHVGTAPSYNSTVVKSKGLSFAAEYYINRLKAVGAAPAAPVVKAADAVADDVVSQRTDDAPSDVTAFDGETVPQNWFSDRSASEAEKEAAKQAGIFQELNWLEGVTFDDDTGELLGDIDIYTPGKGKTQFMGILRGCSSARAHADYINNSVATSASKKVVNGGWVVVVGMRTDSVAGRMVICAELNTEGRRSLAALHNNV